MMMSIEQERFYQQQPSSIYSLLRTLHANQLTMIGMLSQVLKKEAQMAVDLTALTAEVANNSTVEGSVIALLQQLSTQIANIPPSSDPTTQAALDALVATLSQNDTAIAAAVTANTPATPVVAAPPAETPPAETPPAETPPAEPTTASTRR